MSHIALYRKYRPQNFVEVVGQDHVVKVLDGSIKQGKMAHAYIFSGSRGTGKTSLARIFARELGVSANDLMEIDAASNRGIDDIRALRDAAQSLPFSSKFKIYVLDEVHMLSKDAWNALLKTLEEPPAHVIFILATTEVEKIPETIISRCQVFTLKKPSKEILKDLVLRVAKKEGYTIEPVSAELIATLGDGAFRDTLGILEKIFSFSKDKKISPDEIELVTGAPESALVNRYLSAYAGGDVADGLAAVSQSLEKGKDAKIFAEFVLQKYRVALLLKLAPVQGKTLLVDFSADDQAFLTELSTKALSTTALLNLLTLLTRPISGPVPSLPLELALLSGK